MAALALLLTFMSHYRNSADANTTMARVLVSSRAIQKGTPGDVIATRKFFSFKEVPDTRVATGVLVNSSLLHGLTAARDIPRGEQMTMGDFVAGADPITSKLVGQQRAISVPIDPEHGNVGQVVAGSRVDVIGGLNDPESGSDKPVAILMLAQNALVLKAPGAAGANSASVPDGAAPATSTPSAGNSIVLRLEERQARRVALAAENGVVWVLIRPPTLGKNSDPQPVTELELVTREQLLRLKREVKQYAKDLSG
jgi:Flp pilus assembly protein CpaB